MDPPPSRRLDDVDPHFMDFSSACEIHSTRNAICACGSAIRSGVSAQYHRFCLRLAVAGAGRRCRRHCASTRSLLAGPASGRRLVESQDRPYRVDVEARAIRHRHPHGIVAADRHHSPRGIRPRRREPAATFSPWSAGSASLHWAPGGALLRLRLVRAHPAARLPGLIPNP